MSESSSAPCPSLMPLRAPRITKGAWLRFSIPPARTKLASPRRIICAPLITDWIPLPQSRFTVSAGIGTGTPTLSATCRAP